MSAHPAGFGPLVEAPWLEANLDVEGTRVIDFRWELQAGSRRDQYLEAHIPGAAFLAMEDVTGRTGPGRHPLPTAADFQAAMRRCGVSVNSRVVAYDGAGGFSAARLWWLLGHFGHPQVAVLNGGLGAWKGPVEAGEAETVAGDYVAMERAGDTVDLAGTAGPSRGRVVIDARLPERYRGEVEPIDPRAGHIPGAVNLPWSDNLGADQRFLDPALLRRRFEDLGVRPGSTPVVYCGSGVTACVDILAMAAAGLGAAQLYEGSWSDWATRPDLPVATGAGEGDA